MVCFYQDHEGEQWMYDLCNWIRAINRARPKVTVVALKYDEFFESVTSSFNFNAYEIVIIFLAVHGSEGNTSPDTRSGPRGKHQAVRTLHFFNGQDNSIITKFGS